MKTKIVALFLATLMLAGCGSSLSCSSSDVKDTIKSILVDAAKNPQVISALQEMKIENIATTSVDKDVGTYSCSAQLQYDPGDGKEPAVQDVSYDVQPIESADAEFQVLFDKGEFGKFKTAVALKTGIDSNARLLEMMNDP